LKTIYPSYETGIVFLRGNLMEKGDIYLKADEKEIVFGNSKMELSFSKVSGRWLGLFDKKSNLLYAGNGENIASATITVGGKTTEFKGRNQIWSLVDTKIIGINGIYDSHSYKSTEGAVELSIYLKEGDWILAAKYILQPDLARLERKLVITYMGDSEELLRYAHLYTPEIRVGEPSNCLVEAPGYAVKPHYLLSDISQGKWQVMRGSPDMDAPGWKSGLVVINDPQAHISLMTWGYSEIEPSLFYLERKGDELISIQHILVSDRFTKGHSIECGSQYIQIVNGDSSEALQVFNNWYDEMGIIIPEDISDWARDAILYEVHVGTKGFPKGEPYTPFPDFIALKEKLRYIKDLGFNTIQVMPHFPYPNYSVHHYFDIDTTYGPVNDVKAFIKQAHGLGMRVIFDVVLHGCVDKSLRNIPEAYDRSPYFQHPEWFVFNEKDEIGMTYTYAFDHANEGWRQHLIDALKLYVNELDADGFRVDALTWNYFPNWRQGLPYRASASMYGSAELFMRARKELKAIKPDIFLYTETSGSLFHKSYDLAYNYDEQWMYSAILKVVSQRGYAQPWGGKPITAKDMRDWLEARRLSLPKGAIKVWHTDSHDSYEWAGLGMFRREAFGVEGARLLFAICAFREGALMSYVGAEEGSEDYYRKVINVRNIIRRGRFSYTGVDCSDDMVLPMLWNLDREYAIPVINFRPESTSTMLNISPDVIDAKKEYVLKDILNDDDLGTHSGNQLRSLELRMKPYEAKVLILVEK
jgi:glycosidase